MPSAILSLMVLGGPTEAPIPEPPTVVEFKKRDANDDGMLTRDEYVRPELGGEREEAAGKQSVRFDLDGDGFLTTLEFARTPPGRADPATMFKLLDADSDTILTREEFKKQYRPGYEDAVELVFRPLDANRNDKIERGEFLAPGGSSADTFMKRFARRDENRDGRLSREEYVRPNAGGEKEKTAKEESVRFDLDGDGFLTPTEFALTPPVEAPSAMRFAVGDANQNDVLDRMEFLHLHPDTHRAVVGSWFLRYDQDSDGGISAAEWNRKGWDRDSVYDPVVVRVEKGMTSFGKLVEEFDHNGDGRLGPGEWPAEKIEIALPNVADLDQSAWDRNGDGGITDEEARRLLEVAWGVRGTSGELYRHPTGHVFERRHVHDMDSNGDAVISRDEFIEGHWAGPEGNASIFEKIDANGDGKATYEEITATDHVTHNTLLGFSQFDTNGDGLIDQAELNASSRKRRKAMAPYLIEAFDDDGDGRLDVREYRLTPFANPYAWYTSARDTDYDGRLSWDEFYLEDSPMFIALYQEFFRRFDRDQDASLSSNEFTFQIDLEKIPEEVTFALQDRDGNGKISFAEAFDEPRPEGSDPKQVEAYQMRLMRAEESFLTGDADGDGAIGLAEFRAARKSPAAAAVLGPTAAPRQESADGYSWPIIGFLALDALVLLGVGVWFLRGSRSKS